MPDLSHHDVADEAFHEIQLSGKQLVFLFMATTIVAVVIFLCGVQVGRGVKSQRVADAVDPVASAAALPAQRTTPSAPPVAAEPTPAEPPAPAKETDEGLSYAKRLQSDGTPNDKVKPNAEAAAPVAATRTPAPAPAPAPKETPAKTAPAPTAPASAGRPGVWVVQVYALKDQAAAAALAQRLAGKGYPAFVLNPAPGAPSIFRVQVGRYNDRKEAEQIARRLEKEGQFKPWISH
jgi:cell division septation protein DedD